MSVILSRPGVYVPEEVLTNDDLELLVDTTDSWIISRTGIKERRISLSKGVKEMGVLAVEDLFNKISCDPASIDEIVFSTNKHDDEQDFPSHAGHIANAIGAKKGVIIHDKTAGCTGLVYALREAYNNVVVGDVNKVLVLGVERLTDMTDYSDRNTCVLFGDGAGAYLVEKGTGEGVIKNMLGGQPDVGNDSWPGGYLCLERKDGLKLDFKFGGVFQTRSEDQNYLVMNGRRVYSFATNVMKHAVHSVLDGTGYSLKDVDVIVPHGANLRIIEAAKKDLLNKGFEGVVFTNLERLGNTSTASIPLAADEAIEKGLLKDGSLVINVAFGAGFTYGANLYRAVLDD